ncbi:SBBP repeat-containing protein [Candidatus Saccharibacteria bacterium]|nr:SBBP repeat-containing protein [Candidatus Saccharibacteria bacterium]
MADAFVSKLAATGSTLIYSTYLGGSARESGLAIATDIAGNTYVTGLTNSTDFPVVEPLQSGLASDFFDAFICKINATGSAFFYSTYLGGSGNEKPLGIFADAAGSLYTIGTTDSTDFPTVTPIAESGSFFIAKIDPALIAQAESATLAKGVSATVAVLPSAGNPGISALVTNEDDGVDRSMAVTVSRLLRITHTISLIDMGGNYFDIKAERADSNDRLTVSLYYPNTVVGAAEEVLSLQYYDGIDIEAWQPLRNSGAADPIKDTTDNLDGTLSGGKFSFTLDNTSSPKITNLNLSAIGSDIIDQSVSTIVPEGSTNTVSILPTGDKAGISTTVSNVETFNSLTVRVARFSTNPGTSDVIDIGGGFVDLKIEDADPKDRAVVDLYYPDTVKGATETALGLRYFDSVSWQLLKGSGRADPVKTTTDNLDGTINGGKFRFTLDDTSSIKITELSGTVFTATTVTPTPPPPQPEVTIEALINRVESLEDLKKGDKKQLVNKLKKAQKELAKDKKAEKDKSKKAIKQLEKFIKKVEQLRDKKDFDKVEANTLIEWARIIIADIQ